MTKFFEENKEKIVAGEVIKNKEDGYEYILYDDLIKDLENLQQLVNQKLSLVEVKESDIASLKEYLRRMNILGPLFDVVRTAEQKLEDEGSVKKAKEYLSARDELIMYKEKVSKMLSKLQEKKVLEEIGVKVKKEDLQELAVD